MSLVYLDPANLPEMDETTRQTVIHLRTAIDQRTILPMVHHEQREKEDGGLNVVPAFVDAMTTRNVEYLLNAIRTVAGQVMKSNSNHCRCAERYNELEDAKLLALRQFADAKPSSSKQDKGTAILNARLEEIDRQLQQMFGGEVPPALAMSASEPPCKFCGKPRSLPEWAAFTEPSFLQNLLNLSLGGEFPLNYLPLLLEAVDAWIYNPDLIPPAKKKRVNEVLEKMGYLDLKDRIVGKLTELLGGETRQTIQEMETLRRENERLKASIETFNARQKTTQLSTATMPTTSDSPRPKLTNDFHPELDGSIISSTSKPAENS